MWTRKSGAFCIVLSSVLGQHRGKPHLTDANKNVCALVSESGEVVAKYDYTPFGKLVNTFNNPNSAFRNPFLFSSEYFDEETGLVYYNYRYYNPELGRWMSQDPIGESGGYNLYAFVSNSSINLFDLYGLIELTHASKPANATSIVKGLKAGTDGVIWLSTPNVAGSGASYEATAHFFYEVNVNGAIEIPEACSRASKNYASKSVKGSGLTGKARTKAWGRAKGEFLEKWAKSQSGSIFWTSDIGGKYAGGKHYIIKPSAWKQLGPRLMKIGGPGRTQAIKVLKHGLGTARALNQQSNMAWNSFMKTKKGVALRVGGRVLIVTGMAMSAYEIYTAENKAREATRQVGGWAGAMAGGWAGGKLGGSGGAGVGSFFGGVGAGPGAIIGGLVGAFTGAWAGWKGGTTVTETIYDWVFEPGLKY